MRIPARIVWPAMVVGLLGVNVTLCAITVVAAHSDESFAIEPDYYEKAVKWDEHADQVRAFESKGWSIDASLVAGDVDGAVSISVRDASGHLVESIDGMEAVAFHNTRAQERFPIALTSTPRGSIGVLPDGRAGHWTVLVTVTTDEGSFESSHGIEVPG